MAPGPRWPQSDQEWVEGRRGVNPVDPRGLAKLPGIRMSAASTDDAARHLGGLMAPKTVGPCSLARSVFRRDDVARHSLCFMTMIAWPSAMVGPPRGAKDARPTAP